MARSSVGTERERKRVRGSARCVVENEGWGSGTVCVQAGWGRRVGQLFGPGLMNSRLFDLFNLISNGIDLIRSKEVLPDFKKFQIKYGFEAFEIRNNFPCCAFHVLG
jgi:hypothetical protein